MSAGPWRREAERRLRRGLPPWVITWIVAAAVMCAAVRLTECALRPVLSAAARYQVRSQGPPLWSSGRPGTCRSGGWTTATL